MKTQLISPKHGLGRSIEHGNLPPIGLLTIANYVKQEMPDTEVEVIDGNSDDAEKYLDSKSQVYGIGCWFSNYSEAVILANKIKAVNPHSTVVFGGPNANGIGDRILRNNPSIDYVVCGDGERAFTSILRGQNPKEISGVTYRAKGEVHTNAPDFSLDINTLPFNSLDSLVTPFSWEQGIKRTAHNYYPTSNFRGCFRQNRCKYCSIPLKNQRASTPEKFWGQIRNLHQLYGIDHFFETADTFPIHMAKDLLKAKPSDLDDVALRAYIHPGMIDKEKSKLLAKLGFKNLFIGVENTRFFADTSHKRMNGRYSSNYQTQDLVNEIEVLGREGITVMPSFVLGLPEETDGSIDENMRLIERLSKMPNVKEMNIGVSLPLPGSQYFFDCVNDSKIIDEYQRQTGKNLRIIDDIDYYKLAELFVNRYTSTTVDYIGNKLRPLINEGRVKIASYFSGDVN